MIWVRRILPRLIAASTLTLAAACSSPPQETQSPQAANAAYLALDFSCTRGEATDVEFDALYAHPEKFSEKCIRVKAFSTGIYLLKDAAQMSTAKLDSALPTYLKDKETEMHLRLGPSFVVAVGRVRSCAERMQRAALPARCRDGGFGLFVSDVQIVPTAMD